MDFGPGLAVGGGGAGGGGGAATKRKRLPSTASAEPGPAERSVIYDTTNKPRYAGSITIVGGSITKAPTAVLLSYLSYVCVSSL